MAEQASALLALWNDVDPALDAQYNEWHAIEHVPERLTVPGILWGRRYGRPASDEAPRYLTLYGLRDAAVLDSEPYQRLLREPTTMSRTMRPALRNVSRWVCRLHRDDGPADADLLAVWTLPHDDGKVHAASHALVNASFIRGYLLAERLRDASPLPWLSAGQDRGIEGDWLLCAAFDERLLQASALSGASVYSRLPVDPAPAGRTHRATP